MEYNDTFTPPIESPSSFEKIESPSSFEKITPESLHHYQPPILSVFLMRVLGVTSHIGLLYWNPLKNQLYRFDLLGHCRLKNEVFTGSKHATYAATAKAIPPLNRRYIAVALSSYSTARQTNSGAIPYGLNRAGWKYDKQRNIFFSTGQNKSSGLTCASALMTLFDGFGFILLKDHTWQKRANDRMWVARSLTTTIQGWLQRLNAVIALVAGTLRFRPSEVAAALISPEQTIPLEFKKAGRLGKIIDKSLSSDIPIQDLLDQDML